MKHSSLILLAGLLGLVAQSHAGGTCDFSAADAQIERFLQPRPTFTGVSVQVGFANQTLWSQHYREFDASTVVSLASASKLLSGMLFAHLDETQELPLDTQAGVLLASFTGTKATMLVSQMLSMRSGFSRNFELNNPQGADVLSPRGPTNLAEASDVLGCCESLQSNPAEQFSYGGAGMHAAGRMAEISTGTDYEQLIRERIAIPLGATSIDFQGLGETANYMVSGGARSTIGDYAKVLSSLLLSYQDRGGLLSQDTARAMFADRLGDTPTEYVPNDPPANFGYGVGVWLERDADGRTLAVNSDGRFGYSPWIDLQSGFYFVYAIDSLRTVRIVEHQREVFDLVRAVVASGDCDRLFGNGFEVE